MDTSELIKGGLYHNKNGRIVRTLLCDHIEVLSDSKHYGEWRFGKGKMPRGYRDYNRLSKTFFDKNYSLYSIALEGDNYSENKHYAHLPLRLLRFKQIPVGKEYKDWDEMKRHVELEETLDFDGKCLDTPFVYLAPRTKTNRHKPLRKLEADNQESFSVKELLWKINELQLEIKVQKNDLGLYRDGLKQHLPTFYIGGFYDLAGNVKRHLDNNNISELSFNERVFGFSST